jgi:hypothetical protein
MSTPLRQLKPNAERFDPTREYVSSGGMFSARIGSAISSLLRDEAELALGAGGYERMLTDPEILKNVTLIVDAVLGDGLQLMPLFTDDKADKVKAEVAAENAALCRFNLFEAPRKPFKDTLRETFRAAYVTGHKIAEQNWRFDSGPDGETLLVLDSVKCKPRDAAQFVVDEFMNVLGIQVWSRGQRKVVEREKFFILAFESRNEDPRGSAPQMRACYNYYVAKKAALPIRLKRLEKKALPSVAGFVGPTEGTSDTYEGTDSDGNTVAQTPTEVMADRLASLGDGNSAAAFAHGAKVQVIDTAGNGVEFDAFEPSCDRQITRAHLLQDLATNEGEHGTRAMASEHVGVLALRIWHFKNLVAEGVRSDICKTFLSFNREPEKAALVPLVTLGDSDRRDWASDAAAAVMLGPLVTDSIWESLVAMLGLPQKAEGEEWPGRGAKPSANGEESESAKIRSLPEALALHASLASSIRAAKLLRGQFSN